MLCTRRRWRRCFRHAAALAPPLWASGGGGRGGPPALDPGTLACGDLARFASTATAALPGAVEGVARGALASVFHVSHLAVGDLVLVDAVGIGLPTTIVPFPNRSFWRVDAAPC